MSGGGGGGGGVQLSRTHAALSTPGAIACSMRPGEERSGTRLHHSLVPNTRGSHLRTACGSVCDRDQKF